MTDTLHPLIPLADKLVVRKKENEDTTLGGVLLPETVRYGEKQRPQEGEVLAMGPGRILDNGMLVPISDKITIGSRILFTKFAGSEVHIEDDSAVIIAEREVLAVLRPGASATVTTPTLEKGGEIPSFPKFVASKE